MGNGIAAFGTTLSWNAQEIAELTSIGGPAVGVDTIDISSHDSASAFREFVAGFGDAGEVSLEGNFYPGDINGQQALLDDMLARTERAIIITFPDTTTFSCDAICTAFEPSAPFDDKLSFSATLKLTGLPTFTPAGS
jgi:predicted secreted protein